MSLKVEQTEVGMARIQAQMVQMFPRDRLIACRFVTCDVNACCLLPYDEDAVW
jgi:hypothetical protein